MTTKPPPDDEEEPANTGEAPIYIPKRPRNLIALMAVIAALAMFALGGIMMALLSHKEDPAAIKIPAYAPKGLAEEPTPVASPVSVPAVTTPAVPAEVQQESPINLNPEEKTAEPAPTPAGTAPQSAPATPPAVTPEDKATAPQSMIQWDNIPVAHKIKIAIVIDDMGLNHPNSRRMVAMSRDLTLSYLPYSENLPQQTAEARDKGHELIVHVPMEPDNLAHNNPGPNALLTTNTAEQNVANLEKDLSQFDGYIGLNNHMGSKFTSDPEALRPILAKVKEKGLWFLDSKTIGNSVAGQMAQQMSIPYVSRDVFLDNTESVPAVLAQLHQLEIVAKKKGYAVAIGHPHNATITALQQWIPEAQKHGIELVPLSAVIAERYPSAPVPQYAQLHRESKIEPAAGLAAAAHQPSPAVN